MSNRSRSSFDFQSSNVSSFLETIVNAFFLRDLGSGCGVPPCITKYLLLLKPQNLTPYSYSVVIFSPAYGAYMPIGTNKELA